MNVKRMESSDKNVSKYVFEFPNAIAEAVLYKYNSFENRTVICCSTQSGCPIGCRFCGTGERFVRSLTFQEIVNQPQFIFEDRKINPWNTKRLQIMFMSMGEPLLNFSNVSTAIRILHKKFPNADLLISTSAPRVDFNKLRFLSHEIPKVGLQFSVHESTDKARDQLIPFSAKLTLSEIANEGVLWHASTGRQPFFNYCAHDKNTSGEDADRLKTLFDSSIWQATISVICERDETIAAANERQRLLATKFRQKLELRGFSTKVFDPAGQDDIGGGCGQLWFVQDWMKKNKHLTKKSAGAGHETIHTPR